MEIIGYALIVCPDFFMRLMATYPPLTFNKILLAIIPLFDYFTKMTKWSLLGGTIAIFTKNYINNPILL
jgi:hypothetical protein